MSRFAILRLAAITSFLSAAVVLNSGCMLLEFDTTVGSGITTTEDRETDSFHSIDLSGAANTTINCGTENSVKVTIDDNIMEQIHTEVRNETLHVHSNGSYSTKIGLDVELGVDELESLSVSGAVKATVVDCNSDFLKIEVSGAAKVTATGHVKSLTVEVSGAAKVDLTGLEAETVVVDVSGASKVSVNATTTLQVDASGAASVSYEGDPVVTKDLSGAAKVNKVD